MKTEAIALAVVIFHTRTPRAMGQVLPSSITAHRLALRGLLDRARTLED